MRNPSEMQQRFSERIQALAVSQDLLVNAEWKGVGLADLIRGQLAHFQDLIGARIQIKGPPFVVSASAGQTLGMAFHELATNAGKHGALSCAGGCVAIDWSIGRDGTSGQTFTLSWLEQGGPAVAKPSRPGFGSKVVGSLAESALNAKVDLEFLDTGLSWRLRCPVAEIAEEGRAPPAPKAANSAPSPIPIADSFRKVLVVEDGAFIALEIAHVLKGADFNVVGPARSVARGVGSHRRERMRRRSPRQSEGGRACRAKAAC